MREWKAISELPSIMRFHIVLIAIIAAVTFGWIFFEKYLFTVALLGGLDWLLINLLNRLSDTQEDTANKISGSSQVAQKKHRFLFIWIVLQIVSLGIGHILYPVLTIYRVIIQVIGIGYSYPIIPFFKKWHRLKEIYFLKNFMSGIGFIITVFIYPLAVNNFTVSMPGAWPSVIVLGAFFLSFEISYEIIYDMRDLAGDRKACIPTYPVVHGLYRSRQIVDALLILSASILFLGLSVRIIGIREGLMLFAPIIQFIYYRPCLKRGITSRDCINLTHLGSALLLFYLVGTFCWLQFGLPKNIYIVGN